MIPKGGHFQGEDARPYANLSQSEYQFSISCQLYVKLGKRSVGCFVNETLRAFERINQSYKHRTLICPLVKNSGHQWEQSYSQVR